MAEHLLVARKRVVVGLLRAENGSTAELIDDTKTQIQRYKWCTLRLKMLLQFYCDVCWQTSCFETNRCHRSQEMMTVSGCSASFRNSEWNCFESNCVMYGYCDMWLNCGVHNYKVNRMSLQGGGQGRKVSLSYRVQANFLHSSSRLDASVGSLNTSRAWR